MRLTYVRSDSIVGIDGEFYKIDNSLFEPDIDAIQWYGQEGEIEYIDRQRMQNSFFNDENFIQPLVDLWNNKKQEIISLVSSQTSTNFIDINQNIINNE